MAWQKLATTTLTQTSSDVLLESWEGKTFQQFVYHCFVTGGNFNNRPQSGSGGVIDTGNTNAYRLSADGGAENLQDTLASLGDGRNNPNDVFRVLFMSNIATEEKLFIQFEVSRGLAGAGGIPERIEVVGKHVQTSVKDDIFRVLEVGTGILAAGSNLSALGTD